MLKTLVITKIKYLLNVCLKHGSVRRVIFTNYRRLDWAELNEKCDLIHLTHVIDIHKRLILLDRGNSIHFQIFKEKITQIFNQFHVITKND